jgi:hypothetical protein
MYKYGMKLLFYIFIKSTLFMHIGICFNFLSFYRFFSPLSLF